MSNVETIPCPNCSSVNYHSWATELGFNAVRCADCALIYVNPRPRQELISNAVRTGAHGEEASGLVVVAKHVPRRVGRYHRLLGRLFADVWSGGDPISWLDVGAGYGEVVEAVNKLAPSGSRVEGLEPMQPKARNAVSRGLNVHESYLRPGHSKVRFVSVVDVFSHIPDFNSFLADVRSVLLSGGELFLETGNLADLGDRDDFPGELGLPDHLVFAGERQIRNYLNKAGFEIVRIERMRVDGMLYFAKNIAKKILGRPVILALPYSSKYRQLLIRARVQN